MIKYVDPHMRELRTQSFYAPAEIRARHARHIESLLLEIDPASDVPLRYLLRRVTGFDGEETGPVALPGRAVMADLITLLDELSRDVRETAEGAGEPVLDMDAVAERTHVCVRTVRRWRKAGLAVRWFLYPDARLRLGVRESLFNAFCAAHRAQLREAADFTRLDDDERRRIVEAARRVCAATNLGITAVSERVAEEVGRAPETVRYTLRAHDRAHPEARLFRPRRRRLSDDERRRIAERYRAGVSIDQLCIETGKSRSTVYAVVQAEAVAHVLGRRIRFVANQLFEASDADDVILGEAGLDIASVVPPFASDKRDPDAFHAAVSHIPILSREQERDLFQRYNYLKYRMARIQQWVREKGYDAASVAEFDRLTAAAEVVRRDIINSNLRLVAGIARRHTGPLVSFSDLMSAGVLVLMRAVESFDYARGNKFSTYATWAVTKEFARTVPEENYRLALFQTGNDELLRAAGEVDEERRRTEALAHLRHLLDKAVGALSAIEGQIIRQRFGLELGRPLTLSEVGDRHGLSAERVRQIQNHALTKLRAILDGDHLGALSA